MTAPASRPRPARRALDELSLPVDASLLDGFAATEPDWLTVDRRAAFEAWSSLPGESNLLYTPYIDLRAAQLDEAQVVGRPAATDAPGDELPADTAGLIEITDGRVTTVALSEDARARVWSCAHCSTTSSRCATV